MSYAIPFTTDSVKKEICGRTMVLGHRRLGRHAVERTRELVLLSAPGSNDVKWEVVDGAVLILDDRMVPTHVANAVEVANGRAFLSGDALRTAGERMVMYERSPLGEDFRVFVSSHVAYEDVAVPKLLRSLEREGVRRQSVTVVVAECDGEPSTDRGYIRVPVRSNFMGCTALLHLLDYSCELPASYALVLHDTCEVAPGFAAAIGAVDVGLPYDLVEGMREISLWSKQFLERLRNSSLLGGSASPYEVFTEVGAMCRLSRNVGEPTLLKVRDVYGAGVKRKVFELPELAVRKFLGDAMTGGRP